MGKAYMRVGLIDVDGHNFPNIPLMKLSAFYKQQRANVEWHNPEHQYDVVHMSKVFSFTDDYILPILPKKYIKAALDFALI